MDMGKSVTYVVMFYQQAPEEQRLSLSARIDLDLKSIVKFLEEAIANWRVYHLEKDEDWSDDEKNEREERAMTAKSLLHAIFRDMDAFRTEEHLKDKLHQICSTDSTLQEGSQVFIDHVESTMQKQLGHGKYEAYQEASTPNKLREWLDPALEDRERDNPVMWTLVKWLCKFAGFCSTLSQGEISRRGLGGVTSTDEEQVI